MAADPTAGADARILSLFENPGPVETNTPGAKAWLARDASDGRKPVLIKRIAANATGGKGRATEALALLHPSVVRTRRWLQDGPALYVVRDVVRGRNLKQALAGQGPSDTAPTPEVLRRLLLPVIEALEYAHGQGVSHGGVSPENVLLGEDGRVYVSDFATADPKAPQHFLSYAGSATAGGDVKALGRVLTQALPRTGPFANPVVRGRIEGILERCDTLTDLRETVSALEKLAAAPVPRQAPSGKGGVPPVAPAAGPPPLLGRPAAAPSGSAPPVLALGEVPPTHQPEPWVQRPGPAFSSDPPPTPGTPRLTCTLAEKTARVAQGGGGAALLVVRNEGDAPLVVRMIATQHPWLNVRPMELPITLPPGGAVNVGFAISAARLSPGDYRSEVYLSANAAGKGTEDLRYGWFKHTCEVRIAVEAGGATPSGSSGGKPPYPADAPRLPATPGCGLLIAAVLPALTGGTGAALWWLLS